MKKIFRLTTLSRFDVCHENCSYSKLVYRSGSLKLFKCLLSSKCQFDCKYCYNPWHGKDTITPEEFSKVFLSLYKKGLADSVFISSGIYGDVEKVMNDIIEAGELIRKEFSGYIHLKIIPGANKDQIKRATEIANRISINAEVADEKMLSEVCSVKSKYDILRRERWIAKYAKNISHTTQIVVGLGETDKDILSFMKKWYSFGVKRIYFSPFRALKGTPYENKENEKRSRIINLYRADWLVRKYGYDIRKLEAVAGERFKEDPKLLVAKEFGINNFLEIPGIGFKAAKLMERGYSLKDLKKMGFKIKKALSFLPEQKKISDFL